jgi:hypothetical protein
VCDLETSRTGAPYIYDISSLRVKGIIKNRTVWGDLVARMEENRIVYWLLMGKSDEKGPHNTCE